jgi:hypothetical protein
MPGRVGDTAILLWEIEPKAGNILKRGRVEGWRGVFSSQIWKEIGMKVKKNIEFVVLLGLIVWVVTRLSMVLVTTEEEV